jgi:hypothetical protein
MKVGGRFGGKFLLFLGLKIGQARKQHEERSSQYSTLIEATCSSETSVDFQEISRLYIPEDRSLCLVIYFWFI